MRTYHDVIRAALVGGMWLCVASIAGAEDRQAPAGDSPAREAPPAGPLPGLNDGDGPGHDAGGGPGFGRRPFGRQRPRLDYDRLSEEEKEQLEAFMRKHFPERFEELARLDETAPRLFNRAINQMLPQLLRLMHSEEDEPEEFPIRLEEVKLSFEIRGAMRRIRLAAGPEERARLLPEVRGLLARKFDLRQRMHRAEIEKLERRLAEAKAGLERREADKEKIIDRELEDVSSGRLPPEGPPGGGPDGPPHGPRPGVPGREGGPEELRREHRP